ncbi:MAG TPA: winged helix-turn-helix domain-containing protein, partial [Pyrinomonadaceae bacterium]
MNGESFQFFEFGPFRLNVADRLLERDRELVPLTPKVFDTLLFLIEHRGHVLEKNHLMELLWPDSFVEESSLTQNISLLRKALGDLGVEHQYIETIPKRGYRFIGAVQELTVSGTELILQQNNRTEILIEERVETDEGLGHMVRHSLSRLATAMRSQPRLTIGAGIAAALILSIFFMFNEKQSEKEGAAIKSIAVLPFTKLAGDTSNDLIGVGMADALILRLSNLDRVIVLPTSSVLKYMQRDKDVLAIAKELGVSAVVDGSFQQDGAQVRVTAHLIRNDGKRLWSGKFDEQYRSNFSLQDS